MRMFGYRIHWVVRVGLLVFFVAPFVGSAQESRYVVVGVDNTAIQSALQKTPGAKILHSLRYHRGFVAHLSGEEVSALQQIPGVTVERDEPVFHILGKPSGAGKPGPTPCANSATQIIPWGINRIGTLEAFSYLQSLSLSRGGGITVCVVDSGVQKSHPDLGTNVLGGENFIVEKGILDPNNWDDKNGHGTHVAGTIAALDNSQGVIGVAPDAKIFASRSLDRNGSGSVYSVAEGIRSCIKHGAQVINLSLGSSKGYQKIHDAIIDAKNAGILIVAASGNDSSSTTSYPAAYPEVIAVSALRSDDTFAWFSNEIPSTGFIAPGMKVCSTTKGSTYASYDGTSMATPHVAGVAALMLSSGSLGLRSILLNLTDEQQGQGLIDAYGTVSNR